MKWFIFVVMLGINEDGLQDTFFYFKPEFPTVEECKRYVFENSLSIKQQMFIEFEGKPIEQVFCVEENAFKRYLDMQKGTSI